MKWVIHYGDGTAFEGMDEDAYNAPKLDVQVIAIIDPHTGVAFEQGQDYFVYEPDRITLGFCGVDIYGMHDHLLRAKQQCVFFGRHMLNEDFQQFYISVMNEYPNKSALTKSEMKSGLQI